MNVNPVGMTKVVRGRIRHVSFRSWLVYDNLRIQQSIQMVLVMLLLVLGVVFFTCLFCCFFSSLCLLHLYVLAFLFI